MNNKAFQGQRNCAPLRECLPALRVFVVKFLSSPLDAAQEQCGAGPLRIKAARFAGYLRNGAALKGCNAMNHIWNFYFLT
jgi:hypothetical protein